MADFISNLRESVELVRSPSSLHYSPQTRIILITPPPVTEFVERVPELTKAYAEAVVALGAELGVPVVNAWAAFMRKGEEEGTGGLDRLLSDGLHLTSDGYRVRLGLFFYCTSWKAD